MKSLLNKPYPLLLNKWKLVLFVSLFVGLFMLVFQPFGLQYVQIEYKSWSLLGYGLVTGMLLLFNLFFLPWLFKTTFREEGWTVGKQILYLSWIVLSISIANYAYSILVSIFDWMGFSGFLSFILFTFSIALLPISAITFATQYIYLKRNLAASSEINHSITKSLKGLEHNSRQITLKSGNLKHQFDIENLILFESEGNYIKVFFREDGQTKTKLLRKTMKELNEIIQAQTLFRCHRAYMINIFFIESVKGNSQGLSLSMKHLDKSIPVSRSNINTFKTLMNQTLA